MASLEHLPYEIHSQIFSHLPQSDLLSTTLVSQALRAVANSIVYRTPHVQSQFQDALIRTLMLPGGKVLANYVVQLTIERSRFGPVELASNKYDYADEDDYYDHNDNECCVAEVEESESTDSEDSEDSADKQKDCTDVYQTSAAGNGDDSDGSSSFSSSSSVGDPSAAGDTSTEGYVSSVGDIATDSEDGSPGPSSFSHTAAIFAFGQDQELRCQAFLQLLHLFSRLQQLNIGTLLIADRCTDILGKVSQTKLPAGLQSLRDFSSHKQGVTAATFCTLLQLPHIRKIVVSLINEHGNEDAEWNVDDDDDDNDQSSTNASDTSSRFSDGSSYYSDSFDHPDRSPWSVKHFLPVSSGTSTVTNLRLRHTALTIASLEHLLTIPRALEHFRYECSYRNAGFNLAEIGRALLLLRDTLQFLWLGCGYHRALDPNLTIGTLRNWPKLHTLRCSLVLLLGGADRAGAVELDYLLPEGLRVFEILADREWSLKVAVERVIRLLSRKHEVLPRLKSLAVLREVPKTAYMWEMLLECCENAGVELVEDHVME